MAIRPVDPRSRVPKYLQVKAGLMRWIQRDGFTEGHRLPSEQELVVQFGVSKMTVRQAVTELVREGFLRRDHGRGTFVTRPRALRRFWTVLSFTEEMRSRGLEVENRLLGARRVVPREPIRRALRLHPREPVLQVRRLRLVHGAPVAYNVSHVPLSRCPGLDRLDLEADSLYLVMQRQYGFRFTRCDRSYRAGTPAPAEARLLGVPPGAPVLMVEGTTFADGDVPVDYCYEVYRE
ncbi:MAG: GntR family transcriptional regulator [Armatimonadota bacterium]|nr:GntR family transcriptional regulator [Armatimonadota bacterium]MDR7486048.1 GntR family transcriptional regulator [Armatimonadota bacterium]MDR7532619.1 GntR family transcriptional regulator [Armatimonadota bacterium]MDR7536172.1 GntR family transcriptional regulator [Armatimonadota bacterium]